MENLEFTIAVGETMLLGFVVIIALLGVLIFKLSKITKQLNELHKKLDSDRE